MSMDPLAPAPPAQEPTKRQLAEENAALKSRVAELETQVASLSADLVAARSAPAAPAPASLSSVEAWALLVNLRHNGKAHEAGELVPFDPKNPPKGCDGLVEGVHYERARVIVRD